MVVSESLNTSKESIRANRRDAAGDRHRGQAAAAIESPIANRRDAAGDRHRGQAAAARESIIANRRDAARDRHRGQAAAVRESIRANRRDATADRQGGQFFFPLEWGIVRVIADVTTQIQLLNGTTGKRSAAGRCAERQGP